MAISERQLEVWSAQGSVAQSAKTYQAIKSVLEDPRAPYARRSFTIFLQGSYGNDTNIYADSDVDIVMCLTSVYYSDTEGLDAFDKARYDKNWSAAQYTIQEFKNEVTAWLRQNFGAGVVAGKKAILVPGENGRRDADVLACAEHHDYYAYPEYGAPAYHKGICFWTTAGLKVVNYPRQHLDNCVSKNRNTATRFKPSVRVLKNMRNTMVADRYLQDSVAPSYFLEGLLHNIPNHLFEVSRQQTVENYLGWIQSCDVANLLTASERHFLVRDGHSVCWSGKDFRATVDALSQFWIHGGR